jgi:hypothetical protein
MVRTTYHRDTPSSTSYDTDSHGNAMLEVSRQNMEIYHAVRSRQSIRRFTDQPVPRFASGWLPTGGAAIPSPHDPTCNSFFATAFGVSASGK